MRDFETISPKKRIARIGGEEIDVSAMSSRITLEFVVFANKYNFGENDLSKADFQPDMLKDMVDIIALVCQKSSKKITADWLLDNLELPVLIGLMQYVFEPMTSSMKNLKLTESAYETDKEGTGKN